jgi:hypothetical protein
MPKVGKRRFPYTPEGMKKAAEYAKKTGQRIEHEEGVNAPRKRKRRNQKGV